MTQAGQGNGNTNGSPPVARTDAETDAAVKRAYESGRYMIAVWHIGEGLVKLFRKTHNFPLQDLEIAQGLMQAEVTKIKQGEGGLGVRDLAQPSPGGLKFYRPEVKPEPEPPDPDVEVE